MPISAAAASMARAKGTRSSEADAAATSAIGVVLTRLLMIGTPRSASIPPATSTRLRP